MLRAEALTFGFPGKEIGRLGSFRLEPGEAVALLGPNGGGKTTLLKTLLGLLAPLAGRVELDGQDLHRLQPAQRARALGYVPQAHAGVFAFSVRDVVMMGRTAHQGMFARPSAADRTAVDAALASLDLQALTARPYTMISGGERQMVLIARALAQQPGFIILDEPTASLDFGNQGKVLRRIRTLAQSGLGIVFSTHDPNHALRFADRVILLGEGTVLADGPAESVLERKALEALYATNIEELAAQGRRAYLPL